jgi:hypothetical protein
VSRTDRCRRWKNSSFIGLSANGVVIMWPLLSTYPMCVLQCPIMAGFRAFSYLSQKLSSAGGETYIPLVLPHSGCEVTPLFLNVMFQLSFILSIKILWHLILFCLTVMQLLFNLHHQMESLIDLQNVHVTLQDHDSGVQKCN